MADKGSLRKAKDFYKKAIEEYERAKEEQSDVLFRSIFPSYELLL